jgi:hypothetical protein
VNFLDGILSWLADENQSKDSQLYGLLDFDRVAVAGHSRGAKLACLHFASKSRFWRSLLIMLHISDARKLPMYLFLCRLVKEALDR